MSEDVEPKTRGQYYDETVRAILSEGEHWITADGRVYCYRGGEIVKVGDGLLNLSARVKPILSALNSARLPDAP